MGVVRESWEKRRNPKKIIRNDTKWSGNEIKTKKENHEKIEGN